MLAVPVPIFSGELEVQYYCIRFQKEGDLFTSGQNHYNLDGAMKPKMLEVINKFGLEALTMNKTLFVPISHISLLMNLEEQCNEPSDRIVFVLDNATATDKLFLDRIKRHRELGYRFACHSKMNINHHIPVIELCDFIFLSKSSIDIKNTAAYLRGINKGINIIVADIETSGEFMNYKYDTFKLFEGPFYRLPLTQGQFTVSPLKINYIQLLNIVRNEDFEIEDVSRIVQQDTALAISLLKLVNSMGVRSDIKSINSAAAYLGQRELRKWTTTVVTHMLAADKPNEITKLSLIRAKFAENIAPKFEMAMQSQGLFLMGLFSTLDIILEVSMENALSMVYVSNDIRNALLHHKGDYYKVLEFIMWFETADWTNVSRGLILYEMESSAVQNAYFKALEWYNDLIRAVVK